VLLFSFQGSCIDSLNVTATFKYYQTSLRESIVIFIFFSSRFLLKTRQEISYHLLATSATVFLKKPGELNSSPGFHF
ncbi:hypothetical protein ON064_14010, partial [Planococcus sp. A6]|uniref:hypothetical protein n=1 Tax=Planococcus sp. A6 TaxID=2992760 RepID=UPI00237B7A03